MDTDRLGFSSKLIHAGARPDPYGSAVTPIYQTSTFAFEDAQNGADRFAGAAPGYIYTRIGNPTIAALEDCIAELEDGAAAVATSSGMAAVTTACLAMLRQGDHVVSTASVYGPTRTLLEGLLSKFGVRASFVDTSNLDAVREALRPETRMIYVETPSNPMMQVTDIRATAALAHGQHALLVVDSTFASPRLQKPLTLGADVVLHSMTKFINGHADVVGGVLASGMRWSSRAAAWIPTRRTWCTAGSRPWTCGCPARRRARSRSRPGSRPAPMWRGSGISASHPIPITTSPGSRCAASAP